jgi:hypothetical protein
VTLYVIAGFYAVIAAVWGQYAHNVNGGKRVFGSFIMGVLWPITIPLAFFLAWLMMRKMKRAVRDMELKLQEAREEFNRNERAKELVDFLFKEDPELREKQRRDFEDEEGL